MVSYIPNVFFILLFAFITHQMIKIVGILSSAISRGAISFPKFHKEWANPTEKIIKFLIILLAIIMTAPYLPGFDTPAFKGITIFLGIILSLGSTAAVANIVAGLVLIYMRAFRVGDRVKVNNIEGDIKEHSMLITRIRTIKNRIITIPNSLVLASPIINYSIMAENPGIVISTTVTIGYDVPWRKVHTLLMDSAIQTANVLKNPNPFIMQSKLDDYSITYELNAYTNQASNRHFILSELHQHIQDNFNAANIEIMSPQYTAIRKANQSIMPE